MTNKKIYLFSISSHPDAISINSLDITFFKPDIDFSHYDALIITSKQASKALLQYKKEDFVDIPALAISKQSAKAYEDLGGKVLEVGGGYGDSLAEHIKCYPKEKRWLYLRALEVASNFVELCRLEGYEIDEAIMYKSECSKEIQKVAVEEDAVLIFTSPSSVHCFLKDHCIQTSHLVIVIGKTTAKALPENINYIIASSPTMNACFEVLKLTT